MNKTNLIISFGMLALAISAASCSSESSRHTTSATSATVSVRALDPESAQFHAKNYLDTLLAAGTYRGPVCLPEAVVDGMTQCSYSMDTASGNQIGTLLCGNTGCREGQAPAVIPQEIAPQQVATNTSGHSSISDDWLFWYLLYNNGGTTHYYHSWYDSTPPAYRGAYYSTGYRPAPQTINYYHTTYSAPISRSSQRFVGSASSRTVTTAKPSTVPKPTSGLFGSSPAKTTPTKTTPISTAPKPLPKPAPKRSTGIGAPTRSTGSSRRR